MKKFVIINTVLLFMTTYTVMAQQYSDLSLYNSNMFILNPAYAGTTGGINVATGYRKQWLGIEGAPKTLSFSAHAPVEKYGIGAGLVGWQYKIGAFTQTSIFTGYSYGVELGFAKLNFGLQAGIINNKTDYASADLNGVTDPLFLSSDINETKFNVGTGAFLLAEKYYAGISAPLLINSKFRGDEAGTVETERPVFFTGGYLFDLKENIVFKPFTLMRIVQGSPFNWDLGASVYYNSHFGLGVLYKSEKTVAFNVEVIFENAFYVAYSYDLPGGSELSEVENGSHEIMLNYLIPWKKGDNLRVRYY